MNVLKIKIIYLRVKMKVNKNIYFKLVIANIIFFIFVLIMSVLINDNLNEATVDFDSKLYSLEKLDQITESQYEYLENYLSSKINLILFFIITYPVLLILIWGGFNAIENNIMHKRKTNLFKLKSWIFQCGLILLFIFKLLLILLMFSSLITFINTFLLNIIFNQGLVDFFIITLTIIFFIIMVFYIKLYYLITINENFSNAFNSVFNKKIFTLKNILKLFVLLITFFIVIIFLFLINDDNLFYFSLAIFLSLFFAYFKLLLYTLIYE